MLLPLILTVALSPCEQSSAFAAAYRQGSDTSAALATRRSAYENAIATCRGDVRPYRELAALLLANRLFGPALAWLEKGLTVSPRDPELHVQQAAALVPLNKPKQALAALDGVASPEASFYRGMSFRLLQDHKQARDSFSRSWNSGFKDPYVLYSLIQEEYALHEKQSGLEHFELLLKTYPDSAWVHLLLADAYFSKEQNDQAQAEYQKALAQKPDVLGANFRLGYIAFQTGERESAARYFRNEIALNPNYPDAHMFLAECLLELDRRPEAIEQFRAVLAIDDHSGLAYKRLATLLTETNQLAQAKTELSKAASIFPTDPSFPAQLAHVLTLMNEPKEAEVAAARARSLTAEQHREHEALLKK